MYENSYDADLLDHPEDRVEERDLLDSDSEEEYSFDSFSHSRTNPKVTRKFANFSLEDSYFENAYNNQNTERLLTYICDFFQENTTFHCMPPSSKVIVFDMDIGIDNALRIACENEIPSALLYDSKTSKVTGMFTLSDLVDILLFCHCKKEDGLIVSKTIRNWMECLKNEDSKKVIKKKRTPPMELVSVSPDLSLWDSIKMMLKYKIHRLPILKNNSLLHIITDVSVITYLARFGNLDEDIFNRSLGELEIGAFKGILTCKSNQKLYHILEMFCREGISCVPVIDDDDVVIDIYTKSDIAYLLREENIGLDCTIKQALESSERPKTPLFTCRKTETFRKIVRHLAGTRIHKLVCVDVDDKVEGIISISDIFERLIKHHEME